MNATIPFSVAERVFTPEERQMVAQWSVEVDALAKTMVPTRNGNIGPAHFMDAVQTLFQARGWNFSLYCQVAMESFMSRKRI